MTLTSTPLRPQPQPREPEHPQLRHRWTVEQYDRASDLGLIDGATELIDGEILDMMADGDPHRVAVSNSNRRLLVAFDDEARYLVTSQSTARLSDEHAPRPDVMVEERQPVAVGANVIVRPLLIVEVADTTLLADQVVKGSLYASCGVREYWVLNLADRVLEVYRSPVRDGGRKYGWRYSAPVIVRPPDAVSPLALPTARIEVARMLP